MKIAAQDVDEMASGKLGAVHTAMAYRYQRVVLRDNTNGRIKPETVIDYHYLLF